MSYANPNAEDKLHAAICDAVIILNNGEELAPVVSRILRTALGEYIPTPEAPLPGSDAMRIAEEYADLKFRLGAGTWTYEQRNDLARQCDEARESLRAALSAPPRTSGVTDAEVDDGLKYAWAQHYYAGAPVSEELMRQCIRTATKYAVAAAGARDGGVS